MQKTIIIALLVASAICVQVSIKAADGTTAVAGTLAGYSISMGVIQKCHRSCLTCSGVLVTDCLTCVTGITKQTDGKCGCASGFHITAVATPALACEATATDTATEALCKGVAGWSIGVASQVACEVCADTCGTCGAALATCDHTAAGCWAGLTGASSACAYLITATMIVGTDQVVDQTGATLSLLNGYFYTATGFVQAPCATGCLTCAANAGCSTCATGFTLNTAGTACECGTGFFHTAATAAALDICTACGTGAATCTSATIALTCTDTSHSLVPSSTDSSIINCGTPVVSSTTTDTSATSGSTTDGEASTSATATDAAATSGVLITAASMLLAVILA